jgi:hypothetical protein
VLVKLLYLKVVTARKFWVARKTLVKTDKALTVMYLDNFKGFVIKESTLVLVSVHGYPIDPGGGRAHAGKEFFTYGPDYIITLIIIVLGYG